MGQKREKIVIKVNRKVKILKYKNRLAIIRLMKEHR